MDDKKDVTQNPSEGEGGMAPRARNRTVMLTPEMTGQLRSRMVRDALQREVDEGVQQHEEMQIPETSHSQQRSSPITQHSFASTEGASGGFLRPKEAETKSSWSHPQQIEDRLEASAQHTPAAPRYSSPSYSSSILQDPPMFNTAQGLLQEQNEETEPKDVVSYSKKSPIIGFLVAYDHDENGEVYELRAGRLMITSEQIAHGDYLLLHDETVSPMHAILRITAAGEMQLLDQLSEHGTKIKKLGVEEEEELSGDRCTVGHGDILTFGKRVFHVSMVVRQKE